MYFIYVSIGNSDDKLSQPEWARYWRKVNLALKTIPQKVHFSGLSLPNEPWQNALWCVEIGTPENVLRLRNELNEVRQEFNQESIAWVCVQGDQTDFIKD
jgi:hypothetical protein